MIRWSDIAFFLIIRYLLMRELTYHMTSMWCGHLPSELFSLETDKGIQLRAGNIVILIEKRLASSPYWLKVCKELHLQWIIAQDVRSPQISLPITEDRAE